MCLYVWILTDLVYGLPCYGEDSFSNRRDWQHAIKMIDSGCLFYGRTIPTQEINWSFSHVFSSASAVTQERRNWSLFAEKKH